LYDARVDFSAIVTRTGTSTTSTARPAVTAFSDNIVISFNLEELSVKGISIYMALMLLRVTAARIAHRARAVGCLIRGGVALGPMYHAGGVVFGSGFVEAHRLESEVASSPRVIVQHDVLKGLGNGLDANAAMYKDEDGYWCLDYMTGDLQDVDDFYHGARDQESCNARTVWARHIRNDALKRAEELTTEKDARAAQKWQPFAKRFESSMRSVNGYLFNVDGTPIDFLVDL
jgi:hypothetical protein